MSYLPELHSVEGRRALAEVLLAMFARWGLVETKQAELLGLPHMNALQEGAPLPDQPQVLERAGQLLAIDRALARCFPDDRVLRDEWVVFPNSALGGRSPLAVMLGEPDGLDTVRALIESQ